MHDYDEYYDNYSEFDVQVEEFKNTLKKSIKEEHQEKMARLEKENAELQDVKKNWNNLESEYKDKIRELESAKAEAIREAYRKPIKELLEPLAQKVYYAHGYYEYGPKCDECDSCGYKIVKDNNGKEYKVLCGCKTSTWKYRLDYYDTLNISSISKRDWNEGYRMFIKYEQSSCDRDSYVSSVLVNKKTFVDKFDELQANDYKSGETYFYSEEECQKYIDWLNNKPTEN